ncbi:MAG: FkbM family methyltransferase [bacterium]
MKHINLIIGNLIKWFGYQVGRTFRFPQCEADLIGIGFALLNASKKTKLIRVIQIGAFDGELGDPLKKHLGKSGIYAVLIEPQTVPYEKLKNKYSALSNVETKNVAIASESGEISMWAPLKNEGSPFASISRKHANNFGKSRDAFKEIKVQAVTPNDLLASLAWDSVDLLQVDTEGYDWALIRMFFDLGIEPSVINFERIHLDKPDSQESLALLKKRGYSIIDTEYDRFAYKDTLLEWPKL